MELTSLEFAIFVLAAVILYYTIFSRYQWMFLLVVSYVYYMASGPKNIVFIMAATLITYMAGLVIERTEAKERRKIIVGAALILNFAILAVLKYTNFFIGSINDIFHGNIPLLNLVLPLGISFFTFQSAGYMLDVYWRRTGAEKNFSGMHCLCHGFHRLCRGQSADLTDLEDNYSKSINLGLKIQKRLCS